MTSLAKDRKFDPWRWMPVRVQRVIDETPGVKTYELALNDPVLAAEYSWLPGQFNMLYVPGVGEAAISISGGEANRHLLRHTVRRVGSVTGSLDDGGVGMSLGIRGPFGTSWPIDELQRDATQPCDAIVVAGGIGLAPLRSLIDHLIRRQPPAGRVSILVAHRTPADLLFRQQYGDWQQQGADVQTTVDRAQSGWNGHVGVVTLLLQRLAIPNPESTLVMACGPEVMMRYVAQAALDRDICNENIWVALERNMNCAIGLCGHCQLGPEFICKDGAIFPYNRVAPWLHVQGL